MRYLRDTKTEVYCTWLLLLLVESLVDIFKTNRALPDKSDKNKTKTEFRSGHFGFLAATLD